MAASLSLTDNISPSSTKGAADIFAAIVGNKVGSVERLTIAGKNGNVSNTALDDITELGAVVAPDPGGVQLEVVSSAAADTAAGTGTQTLSIVYLDTSGVQQDETIVMAGIGVVTTVATDIDKIQWMHTLTVGSGGVAAGNILLRGLAGGTTFETITAGGNQSLSCRYHVPLGKTAFVGRWQCSARVHGMDFKLRGTRDKQFPTILPGVFLFQEVISLDNAASGNIVFSGLIPFPALSSIKISAISDNAAGLATASFELFLKS